MPPSLWPVYPLSSCPIAVARLQVSFLSPGFTLFCQSCPVCKMQFQPCHYHRAVRIEVTYFDDTLPYFSVLFTSTQLSSSHSRPSHISLEQLLETTCGSFKCDKLLEASKSCTFCSFFQENAVPTPMSSKTYSSFYIQLKHHLFQETFFELPNPI